MINFKKRFTAGLLILLLVIKFTYPIAVLADESVVDPTSATPSATITPTPTPTPDLSTQINASSNADLTNNNNSTADSGNNSVTTICPTPIPNSATTDGTLSTAQDPCPTPTPDPSINTINTGDSTSVTSVQNNVGVTSINSSLTNTTQTVSDTQNTDLNLGNNTQSQISTPSAVTIDQTSNLNIINNSATLDNTVISVANSGGNSASGSATINTGNSYSVVSVVNNVSLTLVNSTLQILSLNVLGTINGNITLPDANGATCSLCNNNTTQNINNNATVTNNVNSQAISGQNSISDAASAAITSGQSVSIVNLLNLINSLFIGSNVKGLFVNVFGQWNGQFVGWGDISSANGGTSLILLNSGLNDSNTNCNCVSSSNVSSNTIVNNNVTSIANTGRNDISGGSKDFIKTGNAYSEVSILNLVNTTFLNSTGLFAFINIFGTLNGDIGGVSNFTQKEENVPPQTTTEEISNKDQGGGLLSISQSNNVGEYVLPGDTVTFNIKVKNPGSGTVRNAKVHLNLLRDGIVVGKAVFNIGDISSGRGKSLTTGIVLSKNAHTGEYTAQAIAEGISGEVNLSDQATSTFSVYSPALGYSNQSSTQNQSKSKVLSAATSIKDNTNFPTKASYDYKTLIFLALLYFIVKVLRNYKEIRRISESKTVLNFVQFAQKMLM